MSFSDNLRNELDYCNMQVKELSAKTGISKNTLDNYLSGQKSIPNAENVVKIAVALGTSAEQLVLGKKTSSKKETKNSEKSLKEKIAKKLCALDFSELQALDKILEAMVR